MENNFIDLVRLTTSPDIIGDDKFIGYHTQTVFIKTN